MYPILKLKPGKENNVIYRHPWVFSGALAASDVELENGELVHIADANGQVIGTGTYSNHSQISVRVFDFSNCQIDAAWIGARIGSAQKQREIVYARGLHARTRGAARGAPAPRSERCPADAFLLFRRAIAVERALVLYPLLARCAPRKSCSFGRPS